MEAVVGGIGGCCSTGAESEVWMLFWSELKNVALLELNRKRVNFFVGRNSFRINASYDSETRYVFLF